jgi:hypothetical protein
LVDVISVFIVEILFVLFLGFTSLDLGSLGGLLASELAPVMDTDFNILVANIL